MIKEEREEGFKLAKDSQIKINEQQDLIEYLEAEIATIGEQLQNAKAILQESAIKMEIEAKDVITAIPIFSGNSKELESFINTCNSYHELVKQEQRGMLIKIIKAKITGDALTKISPMEDLNTWAEIKKKLREKIATKVSLEYAQEDLNNIFQKKDETIEQYGNRVKEKLQKLNEAIKTIADTAAERSILKKVNERQAISKFEQNIRNNSLKLLVTAAAKESLDECILFASQKELLEKNKNIKSCTFCGLNNHDESSCRKKKGNATGNSISKFSKKGEDKNDSKNNDGNEKINENYKNKSNDWKYNKNGNSNNGNGSWRNKNDNSVKTLKNSDNIGNTVAKAIAREEKESKN